MSYRLVLGRIAGSSHDYQLLRGADSLARNFTGILERLRYCSVGFLVAALLATIYRIKLQTWIEQAILPLPHFLRSAVASLFSGLKNDGKLNTWVLLALTAVGAALRVRWLFQPMGIDESETFLSYASRPLYIGLSWYPAPNNHLLNTLLMHFTWRIFGEQEWSLRLPALLAGILLIPVTYSAAHVLYDKHCALIAASLVAAASPLIYFSADGRGYTMVCVLFLLLLIASQYVLEHPAPPAWLVWSLVAALGFYAIPIMLYAAGTAALWLALSSRGMAKERGRFLASLGATLARTGGLTMLLYLPVLIASGWKPLFSNPWVQPKSLAYLVDHLPASISSNWHFWTADVPLPLVWVLTAAFLTALAFRRQIASNRVPVPLAAILCIPPLVLLQRVVPYERVWLFLIPLAAAVSAAGLWLVIRRFATRLTTRSSFLAAAVALISVLSMCIPDLRGARLIRGAALPRVEDAVEWLQGGLRPSDMMVANGFGWSPLSYYLRRHRIPLVSRPSTCDPETLVYTSNSAPVPGERRVLIIARSDQSAGTILSSACLAGRSSRVPQLVYERAGRSSLASSGSNTWTLGVYESYIGSQITSQR